ncbi:Putative pentatricopeptide repeat-containing protein [Striga hermonthica]|uniref:Pentatricopeptide repeat-containing protein n=1 Tax=Striga hermonthica TaxID=68872 RepID=A0A9N7MCW7_STRHE|nr:Putative pentatricopeptide repeat-containing protein [Striga hermonthica]
MEDLMRLLRGHVPRSHLLQIHARLLQLGAHRDNLVATRLIGQYSPSSALRVFYSLQNPNIFPFNAVIRVLADEGLASKAFSIFKELQNRPLSPNGLTFSFLLKACSRYAVDQVCVRQLHTHILKSGLLSDYAVCNGLLTVYSAVIKDLRSAHRMFDEMPKRNLVGHWTSLISGYAKLGLAEEVLNLFILMLSENLHPEKETMVSILSACSKLATVYIEKWVNALTQCLNDIKCDSLARDHVNTVLVYLYGKCRKVEKSRELFDRISSDGKRSVLSWNTMIGAYVKNSRPIEALSVFKLMITDYYCVPNHVTMVSVLSACAEIGDFELGKWVHEYMKTEGRKGVLSSNVILATALIDMYTKCGDLRSAKHVFTQITSIDVVLYNAMIMGLAVNGEAHEALRLYSRMHDLHLRPNSATFLGALCACSHSGLLQRGREIFHSMIRENSASPGLEHYACYVDLLSRSGFIEEALGVVGSMPMEPNNFVWGALLSGCMLHNRLELAQNVSAMLVAVDPENSAGYVMLSNTLAADSQWRDVLKLRGLMRDKRVGKQPGRSWINVGGVVREFVAGCGSFGEIGGIHEMMESLLKEMRLSSS